MDGVDADPSSVDPADDPGLTSSVVPGVTGVPTSQLVEVSERPVGGQLGVAADLDVAAVVGGVDDEQTDLRVQARSNVMPARSTRRGISLSPSAAAGVQIPPGVSGRSSIKQSAASAMIFEVEP